MKKYHSETPLHQVDSFGCEGGCYEVYKCEEVDAAFAEMDLRNINLQYQRDGLCIKIMVMEQQAEKDRDFIAAQSYGFADEIRVREERHAQEIERLKAEHLEKWRAAGEQGVRDLRDIETMMKQAGRYEKLRFNIKAVRFADRDIEMREFDDLVDRLPASGEEKKSPRKGDYGQECNRKVCKRSPATWHNHGTNRYYCEPCGKLINAHNPEIEPPLCSPAIGEAQK